VQQGEWVTKEASNSTATAVTVMIPLHCW